MTFATDYAASLDGSFVGRVEMAMLAAAIAITNETTVLSAAIPAGAVTSIPVAILATIPSGSAIQVGTLQGQTDVFVSSAAVNSGAVAIPVTSKTTTLTHQAGETVTPPSPLRSSARAAYARLVMNSPVNYASLFAAAVASQGLDGTATDAAISTTVATVWNSLIGS